MTSHFAELGEGRERMGRREEEGEGKAERRGLHSAFHKKFTSLIIHSLVNSINPSIRTLSNYLLKV